MDIEHIRTEIINIGCLLLDKGLIAGTWGNISVRIPNTNQLAITPSGRNYRQLIPVDIPIVDLDGNIVSANNRPSSELFVHLAIYKARTDIRAIVHTHSIFASAFAVARRSIPPIIEDLAQIVGGSVDVAQYALCGTKQLADNTVAALAEKNAVLLANHGVVGCGQSLNEAMITCELVEKSAQIYIFANGLGNIHTLSDGDVKMMHKGYVAHYRQQ